MFRTLLLGLLFLDIQVYVTGKLEENWRTSSSPYFNDVQVALNLLLPDDEKVTVDEFKLRLENNKQGVVIAHNAAGMFIDFWVDGIGIEITSGTFVIKQIFDKREGRDTLNKILVVIKNYVDYGCDAPSEPLNNGDLKPIR